MRGTYGLVIEDGQEFFQIIKEYGEEEAENPQIIIMFFTDEIEEQLGVGKVELNLTGGAA